MSIVTLIEDRNLDSYGQEKPTMEGDEQCKLRDKVMEALYKIKIF